MINPNCDLRKLTPQTSLAICLCHEVYGHYLKECAITSVCDGKHGQGSIHGSGSAFDVRIKNLDGNSGDISKMDVEIASHIVADLKHVLGPQFDVVLESDHIHIEYDPK